MTATVLNLRAARARRVLLRRCPAKRADDLIAFLERSQRGNFALVAATMDVCRLSMADARALLGELGYLSRVRATACAACGAAIDRMNARHIDRSTGREFCSSVCVKRGRGAGHGD